MGRTRSLLAICAVLLFLLAAAALVAAVGLVLGAILAELLVPAITLFSLGAKPVLIQFGWAQTLPLAVAALPVLAVALTIARRPDAAAAPRAAGAA